VAAREQLIRLAVFGQPVARSLSPRIHARFAEQFGLPVEYTAIEATPESFENRVRQLADAGGRGCNVTVPFKRRAWQLAARRSEAANRAEAANTLSFEASGWRAENTDGGGLVAALEGHEGFPLPGQRVALLGAGGAAAGVLAALLDRRPGRVTIANRTLERAFVLADRHAGLGAVDSCTPAELPGKGPFDLVVNATSLGHDGSAPALPPGLFAENALCYDMNYGAAAKPLAARCSQIGVRYADGLSMLVGQAALSFEIWTGKKPNRGPVLEELRRTAGE
jgi:shikimate dehydrogenase